MVVKHRIEPGDTVYGIANQYGTTADAIIKENNLSNPNLIYAGKDLIIPSLPADNSKLQGSVGANNATKNPKLDPLPSSPAYQKGTWDESAQGKAALDAYNTHKNNVLDYEKFDFGYDNWMKDIIAQIKLNPDFKYNFNEDALYQQYKDKYIQQGKLAMADTMGQAAAMTGGYGNSYAQSVGQQAYQAQLDNLNDIIPELYQMALDKYKMNKDDLYNQYGMLSSEYDRQYGQYQDEYSRLIDALGIAKSDYYDGGNMFYTQQNNYNDVANKEFSDAMAIVSENNANAWKQAQWDEDARRYALEDAWKKKVYADSQSGSSGGSGGTGGTGGSGSYGSGSGGSGSGNGGGNNTGAGGTSGITQEIKDKAAAFESNTALGDYLDGLASRGIITEDDADALYAQYMDGNEKYIKDEDGTVAPSYKSMLSSTSGWSVIDDGGINWFGIGIDADAIVKAPNGENIRLDNLRSKLKSEGMSTGEANKLIKALMKNLGI